MHSTVSNSAGATLLPSGPPRAGPRLSFLASVSLHQIS